MTNAARVESAEPWRHRLNEPFYRVSEAARYVHSSNQTVVRWQGLSVVADRAARSELSYMQLIELAVVAAMRRGGIRLAKIKAARDYFGELLNSSFPFAEYKFKAVGREIVTEYHNVDPKAGFDRLIQSGGQLGWSEILEPVLREFVYEDAGIAVRWRVGGDQSQVWIDPRVSFGSPSVGGIATWAIKNRYLIGESVADLAYDFGVAESQIVDALEFEGVKADLGRQTFWLN